MIRPRLVTTPPAPAPAHRWPALSFAVPRLDSSIKLEAGRLGALERNPTPASVNVALRALDEIEALTAKLRKELTL